MRRKDSTPATKHDAGTKLIWSAACLDEALADMLKLEVMKMKRYVRNGGSTEDFSKLNNLLRNTITAMILTSEKVDSGIELLRSEKENTIDD
jgi:hypothetical protein